MSRPFSLESFDSKRTGGSLPDEGLSEEKWLEAFEKGYRDGWEDAERALTRRQGQISDTFAQHLLDLSFTLNEARASVRKDLSSLLRGVLYSLLPGALPQLLGPQILAELDSLADLSSDATIEVVVAPEQQQVIEHMLAKASTRPATVTAVPGQEINTAMLRFHGGEREVDLPAALNEIAATVESYFDEHEQTEERAHG